MGECRHIIAHWTTAAEREQLLDGVDYARHIGDLTALPLLLLRLTQPCDARDGDLAVDPNAALGRLRELAAQLRAHHPEPDSGAEGPDRREPKAAVARELADVFTGLDTWLTHRGYPPRGWAAP